MNTRLIPFFLFVIVSQLSAQTVTIHILSPWAQDSVRSETPLYIISNESGWWPGAQMVSEGGGWYSYTFTETPKTSTERIEFMSVIPTPHDAQAERVFYTGGAEQISMQRLFASDTSAKDVWLSTPDLESEVEITLDAPESRVLYFFNPWDLGAPRVLMTDGRIMRMNLEPSFCGWSSYRYYGTTDSAAFKFLNSMDSSLYTASGLSEGDFINLQEHFTKHDTAWILPTPYPEGPPELHSIFPGKKGDCGVLLLGAVMRDMAVDHPDFQLECMGHKTGMVEKRLDSNGKPIQTDTAQCAFDIASWFQPESLGNGYTNQTCYNMLLQKNDEGLFEIDNDNFFPLDDFEYLDEEETVPNPNHSYDRDSNFMHNYFFTMEISAEFDYSPGQTFYFRGDDDVWVFIDSSLVVDIGGIHGPVEGAVDLDTLGLTPGNTYSFKLFFAERHCCGSNFRMVTSLNLRTSSKIFHKTNEISEGITHYDLFERVTQSNLSCDPGASSTEIREATVDFYIEGPSFETAKRLLAGTSYGGITISDDYSSVVVEENAVTDLLPGGYVIRYYLQSDDTQEGFVSFIVPGDPPLDVNNVVSAFCYADNGYGRLDNLELTYEDTLQALPDSITISWPELENSKTVYPDNMTLEADEKTVSMVLPEPFEGSITTYSGTDRLGVSYMSSPRKETVTFRVKEKIGPLITDAVLLERTEEGLFPDTLLITFSEPVPTDSIMEEALLAITPGGQERALTVLNAAKTYDGVRIIVNQRVYPEDSIRINPQSQLCDYYGNRSHLQNRFVPLQLKLGIPRVQQAYYKDRNADGIVETGILQFNRPVNYYSFQPIFAWPNGAMADTLKTERFTYGQDSSEVIVQLGGAFDKTVENITAGNLNLKYQMTDFNESGFAVLKDSAASVLVSAKYTFSTGDTLSDRDTLEVIFSESVSREFAERPFVFKRGDCDTTYSMTLELLNGYKNTWVFLVEDVQGVQLPSETDSVWINSDICIEDKNTNCQSNPSNKRIPLELKYHPSSFSATAGPNPFNPRNDSLSFFIGPQTSYKGNRKYSCQLKIYDPLGNIVHEKEKTDCTGLSEIVWKGRNSSGRLVGSSTYLAHIVIADHESRKKESFKLPIGVVR